MKYHISEPRTRLREYLLAQRSDLDWHCDGRGICGRCEVELLSGLWLVNGQIVKAPARVKACQTSLVSPEGEFELSDRKAGQTMSAKSWLNVREEVLQSCPEAVVAVDIGTTTLAAVKIADGKIISRAGMPNPQRRYGDDVISRISHCAEPGGLEELRSAVVQAINELLDRLGREGVVRLAVAGNTTMACLLHGIDPQPIGRMPFAPPCREFPVTTDIFPGLELHTLPVISGFLGGDITAGCAMLDLRPGEMLVDLGTNCEIILSCEKGMAGTSAAAGPAFEGLGMGCGSLAAANVISHYRSPEDYSFGNNQANDWQNGKPGGICGSGLIDFLAVEHKNGRLNEFGRLVPHEPSFQLAPGISISEGEIAQLLKAKAAVFAGITTLEEYCGCQASTIFLAGGFAAGIEVSHAIAIGMLPPGRQYVAVGNTSLAGAVRLACQPDWMATLKELSDRPKEYPLNTLDSFSSTFIEAMLLPEEE